MVICGWKPGGGRRAGTLGSLLLGASDRAGDLVYLGGSGTGFTSQMLDDLLARLRPLHRADSPSAARVPRAEAGDARWVRTGLVGEVGYRSRTPDGRLRHPSWRGLRPGKEPREITPSDSGPAHGSANAARVRPRKRAATAVDRLVSGVQCGRVANVAAHCGWSGHVAR